MRRLVLVALLLFLVLSAPASADSIAYVQAGDVWLATPDGARRVQVTHTGSYSAVSQADDGTMIALAPGERLHRLTRDGRVTADFLTPISDGAARPARSTASTARSTRGSRPTGRRSPTSGSTTATTTTPAAATTTVPPCYVYSQRQGVGISHADRYTGPEEFGLMTGWIYPSWMSNETLLRSFSGAVMNDDAVFTRARRLSARPVVLRRQPGLRRRRRRAVERPDDRGRDRRAERREAARLPHDDGPVLARRTGTTSRSRRATSRSPSSATSCRASSSPPASRRAGARWPTAPPRACGSRRSPRAARPATPARWSLAGATSPDWGPADVPVAVDRRPEAAG